MLVLSRQRDETIMIGDEIEITVVDIRGDKVRLGITAPTRISVHRKEVYEAIKNENQRAAQLSSTDIGALRSTGTTGPATGPLSGPISGSISGSAVRPGVLGRRPPASSTLRVPGPLAANPTSPLPGPASTPLSGAPPGQPPGPSPRTT